jgi:hypothetical protein
LQISLDGFVAGPNGELDDFHAGEENLAFITSLDETWLKLKLVMQLKDR